MSKIKAVIFDWAGTTVDYGCFAPVQTFMEVFRAYGLNPTMEETRKPMGMLKIDHIRTMLNMDRLNEEFIKKHNRNFNEDDVKIMHDRFSDMILKVLDKHSDVKPYVLETVEELRKMNIKIGSTTGYTDKMMKIVTDSAKKQGYEPDIWFSPDSTNGIGRPYPYMIFKNIEELKIQSVNEVIKVGDTVSDILEGKNAGVISVGIIEGSSEMGLTMEEYNNLSQNDKKKEIERVKRSYKNAGADYIINDIRGIIDIINTL